MIKNPWYLGLVDKVNWAIEAIMNLRGRVGSIEQNGGGGGSNRWESQTQIADVVIDGNRGDYNVSFRSQNAFLAQIRLEILLILEIVKHRHCT